MRKQDFLFTALYSHATKGKLCKAQLSAQLKEVFSKEANLNSNYLHTVNKGEETQEQEELILKNTMKNEEKLAKNAKNKI